MTVSKHEIEWLINIISEYEDVLPADLIQSAGALIRESNYGESVCVIHPVDEKAYNTLRNEIRKHLLSD